METPPQSITAPFDTPGERSFQKQIWLYLALASALSWFMTILAIKLHAKEEFLNLEPRVPRLPP
jgi:hypothetical protein